MAADQHRPPGTGALPATHRERRPAHLRPHHGGGWQRHPRHLSHWSVARQPLPAQSQHYLVGAGRPDLAQPDRHVSGAGAARLAPQAAAHRPAGTGAGDVDDPVCPPHFGLDRAVAVQELRPARTLVYLLGWPARRGAHHSGGVPHDGGTAQRPALLQRRLLRGAGLADFAGQLAAAGLKTGAG